MLQKILLVLIALLLAGFTNAHACRCGGAPETSRDIVDLTETAEDENRYVVVVKIVREESRLVEDINRSVTIEGFIGRVIETLGGCLDTDEIFIVKDYTSCADGDVSQIKIGAIGLAMDFRENQDILYSFICDTRMSYYNIENNIVNRPNGSISTTTSVDELRIFNRCNLSYEVFPNPSSKSIQIMLGRELIPETVTVTLYDASGRLALKARGPRIVVEQLAAGIYFLQVGSNKDTTPVVVSH